MVDNIPCIFNDYILSVFLKMSSIGLEVYGVWVLIRTLYAHLTDCPCIGTWVNLARVDLVNIVTDLLCD